MAAAKRDVFAGVDLGGTNILAVVAAGEGRVLGRAKIKTKADEGADAVLARLRSVTEQACDEAGVGPDALGGVGIGAPGTVDRKSGAVQVAVNLGWRDVPLRTRAQAMFGVPVTVDNDANAAVFGEFALGAGRGAEHLLGVWVGTGIGGGLVLGGRVHYGAFGTAGEIGHAVVMPRNPPGNRSLEHNCARPAIVDQITRLIRGNRDSTLAAIARDKPGKIRSRMIGDAYRRGDAVTVEVIDHSAGLLGIAVAGWVTVLSLDRVVIGGGLTEALGAPYVDRIAGTVAEFVFPDACRAVKVVQSQLGDDAGAIGAAMLARQNV